MSTLTTLRVELLQEPELSRTLSAYRKALATAERLSYQEAAWYYGFTYQTIRHYIHEGRLKPVRRGSSGRPGWLSHKAMQRYLRSRKQTGAPRKALRNAQTRLQ